MQKRIKTCREVLEEMERAREHNLLHSEVVFGTPEAIVYVERLRAEHRSKESACADCARMVRQ